MTNEQRVSVLRWARAATALLFILCGIIGAGDVRAQDPAPAITKVFFAQHHVLTPDNPLFKLVGNLETLIKLQVYSETGLAAPDVFAIVEADSRTLELSLRGPATLPKRPAGNPILMKHSYDDSFTAIIPKEWIKPGLRVTVELRSRDGAREGAGNAPAIKDRKVFDKIRVGAPTKLPFTMFDVHYFKELEGADYPEGWFEELESKLPVAELDLRRVRGIVFGQIAMPPRGGKPAVVCSSREDYEQKTGLKYDGEQDIALRWIHALKGAAGRFPQRNLYYLNICGVPSGGQGGGFSAVGNIRGHGILIHELGHAFGLPDLLDNNKDYPYRGHMYGIQARADNIPHVGPTWAFDLRRRAFISPIVQETSSKGKAGQWKADPMRGGGTGDQEAPYLFRHFSDYSVYRMRETVESRVAVWDKATGAYARWNQEKAAYADVIENDGVQFPIENDVDVISILASVSGATPEASIVYPPIGPYKAGVIRLFDATSARDREEAGRLGYAGETCNVCFRVTQGGVAKTYLLPVTIDSSDNPLKSNESFRTMAINLPARDGQAAQVDMLHVPGLMKQGVTAEGRILYRWTKGVTTNSSTEASPAK